MSTIKATTLSNLAGSKTVPTDTVVDGSAKAWVNFNGTGTVAIRRAFNVSSITDNGTGNYTANLATAMPDANYSCIVTADGSGNHYASAALTYAASSVRVISLNQAGAQTDSPTLNVAIFS